MGFKRLGVGFPGGFCEHGAESLPSIKGLKFLGHDLIFSGRGMPNVICVLTQMLIIICLLFYAEFCL
jgi:hypothetical protein